MINKLFRHSAWIGILGFLIVAFFVRSSAPVLPDVGQIAYSALNNERQSLFLVDVARDIRQTLRSGADNYHALSWSDDGMRFAFAETLSKNDRLWLSDFNTYATEAVYPDVLATGTIETAPVWSYSSAQVATLYHDEQLGDIILLETIADHPAQSKALMSFPDGATIINYSDSAIEWVEVADGAVRLQELDLSSNTQQTIKTWDFAFMRNWEPVPSPDKSQFIISGFTKSALDYELYLFDVNSDEIINLTNRKTYNDSNPAWSPDGASIAYKSLNGTADLIIVQSLEGSNQAIIHRDEDARISQIHWSPDGNSLAFVTNAPMIYSLCVLQLEDGALSCPIVTRKISELAWRPE